MAAPGREPEISGIPKLHSGRTRYRLLGFPADRIKPCYAWIGWAYPRVRHGTTQWLELVGLASQLQKSWVSRSGIAALPERMICPSPLDRSRALRPSAAPAQHAARAGSGRSRYRDRAPGPGPAAPAAGTNGLTVAGNSGSSTCSLFLVFIPLSLLLRQHAGLFIIECVAYARPTGHGSKRIRASAGTRHTEVRFCGRRSPRSSSPLRREQCRHNEWVHQPRRQ